MKTFVQWAEESALDLPVLVDEKGEDTTDENTKRTGYSHNYPDAYVRSQYPNKYFNPRLATADLDAEAKPRKVKNTAAN